MFSYGKQSISKADIESVTRVLKSEFLTQGPEVKKFEDKLCDLTGAKYAVAVNSGTAALHLSMLALGINDEDEGITSPITFVASANCLRYVGAKVIFADIDSSTGLIDPSEIEKKITPNTKVIIPVHYAGQSADMKSIYRIAKGRGIYVVEDAAHAIGTEYFGYKVGSCQFSDLTTFSFHPVKTITTGEGGAITTNNVDLYNKLIAYRTHGIQYGSSKLPWYYEMRELGYNYRLSDILAALGISQLEHLANFSEKRKAIFQKYKKAFENDPRFRIIGQEPGNSAVFHLFPLLLQYEKLSMSKLEIYSKLHAAGIKLQVHYIPVHMQPYYQALGYKAGDFPNAEAFYKQEISLPLYPSLTTQDLSNIVRIVSENIK